MTAPRRTAFFVLAAAATGTACSVLVDVGGLSGGVSEGEGERDGQVGVDAGGDGPLSTDAPASETGSGVVSATSCRTPGPGISNCGPGGEEDCCTSLPVAGGVFYRGHDGVKNYDQSHPAQLSSFRLDRFEITVGRFRRFVDALVGGWTPPAGSGRHAHLNGGNGLTATTNDGGLVYEQGWDPAWNTALSRSALEWSAKLACHTTFATWTVAPGANETLPINCIDWSEAYAFCLWDGGFLPSDTEFGYAESGGAEQRVYPWSSPPSSTSIDCTFVNGATCGSPPNSSPNAVGTRSPKGDARWGQADLAGNLNEWVVDVYVDPVGNPCIDCAALTGGGNRATRGGGYFNPLAGGLTSAVRNSSPGRDYPLGARCARSP